MNETNEGRPASGRANALEQRATGQEAGAADIDLAGIDPLRWAETRERVAILRTWCANTRHPRNEALEAAARLGITVSHFYRLVATWKKHRDARLVSGHNGRRGDTRDPHGPCPVPDDARAILDRVIERRGKEARFTDVRAEVRLECAAAGNFRVICSGERVRLQVYRSEKRCSHAPLSRCFQVKRVTAVIVYLVD